VFLFPRLLGERPTLLGLSSACVSVEVRAFCHWRHSSLPPTGIFALEFDYKRGASPHFNIVAIHELVSFFYRSIVVVGFDDLRRVGNVIVVANLVGAIVSHRRLEIANNVDNTKNDNLTHSFQRVKSGHSTFQNRPLGV